MDDFEKLAYYAHYGMCFGFSNRREITITQILSLSKSDPGILSRFGMATASGSIKEQ